MNDKIDWLKSRRSIRRYLPDAIPAELIDELITAAIWAPSAHNRQPWRFVVMTELETKRKLAGAMGHKLRQDLQADGVAEEIIQKDVSRSFARITAAPLLILLCLTMSDMDSYPDELRQHNEYLMAVQSTAMAAQNLLLAAHVYGLGGCWMCAPLFCADVVQSVLNLPANWQPQALLTIGYPAEKKQKNRASLSTRVLYR
jgi:coenzyme F420-0:L-glutamate ligase/coenzyme F420-1:gamma-L-glutamate ligase